jgi:hypothetical protein
MRTLWSADPPGPVAVIVYVVESVGETFADPSGATVPTLGTSVSEVAFVDDQLSVALSPFWTNVDDARSVTVGRAAGVACGCAAGAAVFTGGASCLQAPATIAVASTTSRAIRPNLFLRIFTFLLDGVPLNLIVLSKRPRVSYHHD